jgi:hypothetical protein
MAVEDFFDLCSQHSIVDGPCARLGMQPLVVSTARHAENSTSASHRNILPLRVNELVHSYFTSFAKRAAAFLRNSLGQRHFDQGKSQVLGLSSKVV